MARTGVGEQRMGGGRKGERTEGRKEGWGLERRRAEVNF
jgi:hypothetical protein